MQKTQILEKINKMELDLNKLKIEVIKLGGKNNKASLKGVLKDIKINEEDITFAKKSLFPGG